MGFVVTRRWLLYPTVGGKDASVILGTIKFVGKDTNASALWQTSVAAALAQAGHKQVVIRTLVDHGIGALVLTEKEAGFIVVVYLELVGLLTHALNRFAWVADTTAKLCVLHSTQVT